jgi:photosystem II P680 reaction center D2 protein
MMGIAVILIGALLCVIHGATVKNSLFVDDDAANTCPSQETYSIITITFF